MVTCHYDKQIAQKIEIKCFKLNNTILEPKILKLVVVQLVNKFRTFCGTGTFMAAFILVICHCHEPN
jgi:hypothetical protein